MPLQSARDKGCETVCDGMPCAVTAGMGRQGQSGCVGGVELESPAGFSYPLSDVSP